jgi:peptidoglycan hydrolase CwlO-like protein
MKRKVIFAALLSFLVAGAAAPLTSFADMHSKAGMERVEAAIKELKDAVTHFEESKKATNSPHDDAAIEHAQTAIKHAETAIDHAKQVP